MLILDAEIDAQHGGGRRVDVRLDEGDGQKRQSGQRGRIAQLAPAGTLSPQAGEAVYPAAGALLLPGLHDHHLHLAALAVALDSLPCGPPQVKTAAALAAQLETAASVGSATEWLRGVGYHESVAGEIDRYWLDRVVPQRPVRIQHRSGRLWLVNSAALQRLLAAGGSLPAGLERQGGQPTGRIFDADDWLRHRLPRRFPSLTAASRRLAGYGVTGLTDTTPHNGPEEWQQVQAAQAAGSLWQDVLLMGDVRLDGMHGSAGVRRGALKLHLHEHELPPFEALVAAVTRSHAVDRPAAFHCVTRTELIFALGVLACAGRHPGDRIEHAAIAPPDSLPLLVERGVTVVTQPNFIQERGDVYLREVAAADQPWLYRLRGLQAAGIPLAGSTDAPFGAADPWAAMQAAVDRRTADGAVLGAEEGLTPEQAVALFLGSAEVSVEVPAGAVRRIVVGAAADLCLLDRPWQQARSHLAAVKVVATFKDGRRLLF